MHRARFRSSVGPSPTASGFLVDEQVLELTVDGCRLPAGSTVGSSAQALPPSGEPGPSAFACSQPRAASRGPEVVLNP